MTGLSGDFAALLDKAGRGERSVGLSGDFVTAAPLLDKTGRGGRSVGCMRVGRVMETEGEGWRVMGK